MTVGRVNARLEPVIPVAIQTNSGPVPLEAIVDTGFNHELTLPPDLIDTLGLEYAAPVQATLAGDIRVYVDYYRATILWEQRAREVAVLEMDGAPLVGMALLADRRLTIDGTVDGVVRIERLAAGDSDKV